MDFLDNKKPGQLAGILFAMTAIFLVIYSQLFGFHPNNDTDGYIWSIEFFRGMESPMFPNRYLNPLYPLVAGKVLSFLSPVNSLITLNIIFYFGMVLLTFDLLRRVFKSNFIGFISAIFAMTSYAIIRYGLTQVQDIGGFFWYALTLYAGWRWWESEKNLWIVLAGVSAAFGLLTKESGAMAALFVGGLLVFSKAELRARALSFLYFSIWPFVTLIINKIRSADVGVDSKLWYIYNWKTYAPANYHLLQWFGVNASTFNILWIFFAIGIYFIARNWRVIDRDVKIFLIAIFVPSMSYFAWPLFISRTVFISFWFVAPIAVYGIYNLINLGKFWRVATLFVAAAAILFPAMFQYTIRYAHLFQIYNECDKNIGCSWDYFWKNRNTFSKDG